jgi:mannose-6-phosphate isomerase-like protein (cupin superfamily)
MDPIDITKVKSSICSKVVKEVPILTDDLIATTLFFDSNIRIPPHVHEDVDELHYVIRGTGNLNIGDNSRQIKEGMLILIPKNESHCYSTENEKLMVLSIRIVGDRGKDKGIGIEGDKKPGKR